MTNEMKDAMQAMDNLIERMENLNKRGISKTIGEATTVSDLRKHICSEMDKVQLLILEELRKEATV